MKLIMMIKDINVKSLVSGDKTARIILETTNQEDVNKIALLADKLEIGVEFDTNSK